MRLKLNFSPYSPQLISFSKCFCLSHFSTVPPQLKEAHFSRFALGSIPEFFVLRSSFQLGIITAFCQPFSWLSLGFRAILRAFSVGFAYFPIIKRRAFFRLLCGEILSARSLLNSLLCGYFSGFARSSSPKK